MTTDQAIQLFLVSFDTLDNPALAELVKKTKTQQTAALRACMIVLRDEQQATLDGLPAQHAAALAGTEAYIAELDQLIGTL